ncbi:predicted protein [Nematostella vectensis]|uniref:Uncharacterized protein n=1 Tax=Nematostella vectensis TaxID=45351 RepID=A7SZ63_NEMVE|nr:predicted protein [Nematostella vectensis]|eukprot:XP_001623107.1 predicted protein [Nematostella vectensis]
MHQSDFFTELSLTSPDKNNLVRLKAISKSFDDLTSETLYSRWKRTRKHCTGKRSRNRSLLSLPELKESEEHLDEHHRPPDQHSQGEGLQGGHPRGWTICPGEIRSENSRDCRCETPLTDGGESVISDSWSSSEVTDTTSISMESTDSGVEERFPSTSPTPSVWSETSEDDGVFVTAPNKFVSHLKLYPRFHSASDTTDKRPKAYPATEIINMQAEVDEKENQSEVLVTEITTYLHGNVSKTTRSLSEGDDSNYHQTVVAARPINKRAFLLRKRSTSARVPSELQFLKTAEMAKQYLESASSSDDVWLKRDAVGTSRIESRHKRPSGVGYKHKGLVNNNIHGATLGQLCDGSHNGLGCTYALVSQPIEAVSQRDFNNNADGRKFVRKISAPAVTSTSRMEKETDEQQEAWDQVPKEVSRGENMTLNMRKGGSYAVGRSQSFAGESGHKPATMPRLSRRATTTLSNRKANDLWSKQVAKELLDKINKADEKSEKERLDVVERAFEWIRKELADLRAQDKDIMRMFTKIQAGIRHIKFDQSLLLETAEDDFNSSPDLSQNISYSVSETSTTPRRASLL